MKKYLLIFSSGLITVISSCNNDKKEAETTETKSDSVAQKNLSVSHEINKAFETGDYSKLGDYIAADAIDHGENGDVKGLDSIKAEFANYYQQADMKSEIIKEFADDQTVISWLKYKSTMKVDGWGMKAGQKYEMPGVEVTNYKDGKVTEHWQFVQMSDIMKLMGGGTNTGN
ncbi:MAG: nuclear transport factor 2 family protein [Bacteroidia bacterium]|nr:nuclear transport factor 2 family protein [Bacteroidia bacterium]